MKLRREQVQKLSEQIMTALKKNETIRFSAKDEKITSRIYDVIIADLTAEDRLDEEVKDLLQAHAAQLRNSDADYQKMFKMLKDKLAREKKIVL